MLEEWFVDDILGLKFLSHLTVDTKLPPVDDDKLKSVFAIEGLKDSCSCMYIIMMMKKTPSRFLHS
jgi:hypothetical protein